MSVPESFAGLPLVGEPVVSTGSTDDRGSTDELGWADDVFCPGEDAVAFLTRTREALA